MVDDIELKDEDIRIEGNNDMLRVFCKSDKAEQLKQQILRDRETIKQLKQHYKDCKERWCFCKSVAFEQILEGDRK